MTTTIRAIYADGVLRPVLPLGLSEGQAVDISVSITKPEASPSAMETWNQQLNSAKTIQEWSALANACPDPGPEFDIVAAINESRRITGFRQPDPVGESSR